MAEGIISMKSNVSKLLALFSVALLVACVGCGGRSQVHGKVVFSDGSPLTYGTVNFTNNDTLCKGEIQEDGSFKMRTFKPGDGVPPGTYKVYLTDTLRLGEGSGQTVKTRVGDETVETQLLGVATNTLPPEYGNPDQSPFPQVTVKGSIKNLELKIEAAAIETSNADGR